MRIYNETFSLSTGGEVEFHDLTGRVMEIVRRSGVKNGLVHVFAPHATGVVVMTENDRSLLEDTEKILKELVPKDRSYHHPANAHSHIRSMLCGASQTIPLINGEMQLGTWQSLFFLETDTHPRRRNLIVQVIGE